MAFKKYTQCYKYQPEFYPTSKPYNSKDLPSDILVHLTLALTLMGSSVVVGLSIAGPVGAVVGAVVGFVVGITAGVATAIHDAADKWLYHRLICLAAEPKCAIGTVTEGPKSGDLGAFDNDEFFDLILMPHRIQDNYVTLQDPTAPSPAVPRYGTVAADQTKLLEAYPNNEIYVDGFQGQEFLLPNPVFLPPNPNLGYNDQNKDPEELHTASMLHCEAEGDFWVRMKDLAIAIGLLATVVVGVTIAGGVGGGIAGASAGCAIGGLFGPIGCLIGAIIGAIIGAAIGAGVAGAVGAAILYGILQAVFDADPGEVEDANVGDTTLGEIRAGSKVAVLGEHVYDGFHDGWHEFHPLMAVIKVEPDGTQNSAVLTWDPQFPVGPPPPPGLTVDDMRQGLHSAQFSGLARGLRDQWCRMLTTAFAPPTRQAQQGLTHRWTIHPGVDGCDEEEPDIV